MPTHTASLEALDAPQRLEALLLRVQELLTGMGIGGVTPDSVIAAPRFYKGPVLIEDTDTLNRFVGTLAVTLRFVGYAYNDLAFLTVRRLCELYLADSYPALPSQALPDAPHANHTRQARRRREATALDFPICFVLGCPRSGTTLLRTMLNMHDTMWAPGELHLAQFESMGERAEKIMPVLRHMPIPELATRMGADVSTFSRNFRDWELDDMQVGEVYEALHRANPDSLIVDKTPSYSDTYADLEWIRELFPNARFVHLLRNPHDVIRSIVRMQLYKGAAADFEPGLNPHHLGEAIWYNHNTNIERLLRDVPDDRQCAVRYESLVADPESALRPICERLDRAYDSRMANPYAGEARRVAQGAGDVQINFLGKVVRREASQAFYPVGPACRDLAAQYAY